MVVEGLIVIEVVVAPVFHRYVEAPETVRVMVSPLQIDVSFCKERTGRVLTVTLTVSVFVHPMASVPETTYEVFVVGTATGFAIVESLSVDVGVHK